MPIKKKEAKWQPNPEDLPQPPSYQPVRAPIIFEATGIPAISSRDLSYFFNLAASLYNDDPSEPVVDHVNAPPPPFFTDSPSNPGPGTSGSDQVDMRAVLVLSLFRQTLTHITPIAERFHLGPADRQPLYALTAQPSPRSAAEFNELCIKRRDPIAGVWHNVCTSDIEPNLNLGRSGHYRVASLTMDAVPVWRRVASGKVTSETSETGRGNKLCIWWGDRGSLGPLGDTYGMWFESGGEAGTVEASYVVQWGGFESSEPGVVSVKPAVKDASGQFVDPRFLQEDLATLYFHGDGRPPQFVCRSSAALIRLDFIMAGLMTVLALETRKLGEEARRMAQAMGLRHVPY
ncbi:hypothetical protein B0H67DRAFT_604815 [Lasiosphaeris hirsuta]|uniref:Uncharacterized protein n=1 Tax=Lasiosphaeris hirsuta TaxID=260670 RepID=A0AA40E634_9PEZI|nr:hypothetical protein B0H67DRAFT_604815 [Lasiosphaeris hirsuta]